MNCIKLINLYLIFLRIGAILLGGGYVIYPILKSELCDKRNLIEESALVDYFALSQTLPGIVAANISMFLGYKLRGKSGAIFAMFGIITVPFFTIIILASLLSVYADNLCIKGIFWGIGISVIALILLTAREVWQKSNRNLFFYVMFIISLTALVCFKQSPISVIIISCLIGIIIKSVTKKRRIE